MNFLKIPNKKGDKIIFYHDLGRGKGQRYSTGIFLYKHPKNQIEKNHNKEALALIEVKKSNLIIERQAIGSGLIPKHKFKENFMDYFEEYVKLNKRNGNRHLQNSLNQFRSFIENDFISPMDITYNFCKRFRQFLLDKFTGETPANYYARFKWVMKAATRDGYFKISPTEDIPAKSNPSNRLKNNLEIEEYIELLSTPCLNTEVQDAFVLSCYTGLRWVDVKRLRWEDINGVSLNTRIIQKKTGEPITLTLHPIAQSIFKKRKRVSVILDCHRQGLVFNLPSQDGCNKILNQWIGFTSIRKHITWSCARLSFSILLKDKNVDDATIAYLLGHKTTEQVQKTYRRYRPKNQIETISNLPSPDLLTYFLNLEN